MVALSNPVDLAAASSGAQQPPSVPSSLPPLLKVSDCHDAMLGVGLPALAPLSALCLVSQIHLLRPDRQRYAPVIEKLYQCSAATIGISPNSTFSTPHHPQLLSPLARLRRPRGLRPCSNACALFHSHTAGSGAAVQQQLNGRQPGVLCCHVERGDALFVRTIWVSTRCQQLCQHARVTLRRSLSAADLRGIAARTLSP